MVIDVKRGFLRHKASNHLNKIPRLVGNHRVNGSSALALPCLINVFNKPLLQLVARPFRSTRIARFERTANNAFRLRIFAIITHCLLPLVCAAIRGSGDSLACVILCLPPIGPCVDARASSLKREVATCGICEQRVGGQRAAFRSGRDERAFRSLPRQPAMLAPSKSGPRVCFMVGGDGLMWQAKTVQAQF